MDTAPSPEWLAEHDRYLGSSAWDERRSAVLLRDKYHCLAALEHCTGKATQVHHLSYRHWRNEPLFDLVSVCWTCHETITRMDLREMLENLGYSVVGEAGDGLAAVNLARALKPDLVLMDIRLKGKKDGIEAASEIRSQTDVPIVYLTAYSDRKTVDRAKRTDHDGFLLKPFRGRELSTTIGIALQRHALRTKQQENH